MTAMGNVYSITMKIPYKAAFRRLLRLSLLPLRKKETVMGTMGKTQGVTSATSPNAIAWRMIPQREGDGSGSSGPAASATVTGPSPRVNSNDSSSGGKQEVPSQTCHSTVALTMAAGISNLIF